jgi:hypothetical protein
MYARMMCEAFLRTAMAATVLLAVLPVAGVAADALGQGGCYPSGRVPQLPSKARVFVIATLEAESMDADGRPNTVTIARSSVLVAKSKTSGDEMTIVPGGRSVTIRARPSVCVYPADAPLPPSFAGVTPDIIAP